MNSMVIKDLEVNFHKNNYISIKDLSHEIDISENKWDVLFSLLLEDVESVYFYGLDLNYNDEYLLKYIGFCADNVLIDSYKQARLFFKFDKSLLMIDRKYLSQIWTYYNAPSIILVNDMIQEEKVINIINRHRSFISDLLEESTCVKVIYSEFDKNVLWIEHNL